MFEMTRRTTLLTAGAAAAMLALPGLPPVRRAAAADRPALPIPPELRADAKGEIAFDAQAGTMAFRPGIATPTYGFNGPFLGPAIRVRRGERPVMRVTNRLAENITLHWHGLIIPGTVDGGPYRIIAPGETWRAPLPVDQPAAPCGSTRISTPPRRSWWSRGWPACSSSTTKRATGWACRPAGGSTTSR